MLNILNDEQNVNIHFIFKNFYQHKLYQVWFGLVFEKLRSFSVMICRYLRLTFNYFETLIELLLSVERKITNSSYTSNNSHNIYLVKSMD